MASRHRDDAVVITSDIDVLDGALTAVTALSVVTPDTRPRPFTLPPREAWAAVARQGEAILDQVRGID